MFVKLKCIIGSIIIHGYCIFYGHPDIYDLIMRDAADPITKSKYIFQNYLKYKFFIKKYFNFVVKNLFF